MAPKIYYSKKHKEYIVIYDLKKNAKKMLDCLIISDGLPHKISWANCQLGPQLGRPQKLKTLPRPIQVIIESNTPEKFFRSYDRFFKYVKALTTKEAEKLDTFLFDKNDIDCSYEGIFSVYACSDTLEKALIFASKNGLNIMTETLTDIENGTVYTLENCIRYVNRERFYFSKKALPARIDDKCISENDEN